MFGKVKVGPPRPTFWSYPSVNEATYDISTDHHGRMCLRLEHPVLKGIEPKMVAWWYQNLPLGHAVVEGVEYTYYDIFHLSEHGKIWVEKPAPDGTPGMAVGAIVKREEIFGPYSSRECGRVERFTDEGFQVTPLLFGRLEVGSAIHSFQAVDQGCAYTMEVTIGSSHPTFGPMINWFVRNKRFTKTIVERWVQHLVEEVGSLPHFLAQLYHQEPIVTQREK